MYEISEDVKMRVYETFGRNEEMVQDDVQIIRSWLETQPHLPEIMEDAKIRNFLNLSKFSIEKTKRKIDMYYTIRSVMPEVFEKGNPKLENTKNIFATTYIFTLPKPLNQTTRVYVYKQKKPNSFAPTDLSNVWLAIFEIRLHEDFMVDDLIILDLENHTLGDIKNLTPSLLSRFFAVYQKVYALRLKKIVFINCPAFVSVLAAILKAVMKPKILNRVEYHQGADILKELLSKEELPKDYGGEGPSLEERNESMRKKLLEYQRRFDELDTLRVDENGRPEKLNNDEILGFYGSFKKINFD